VRTNSFVISGREDPAEPDGPSVDVIMVSPEYFPLLGIPILAGREFGPGDTGDASNVVIVSEEMARRYWPGDSPIGAQMSRGEEVFQIVGIARDTKVRTLGEAPRPLVYYPVAQRYSSMTSLVATGPASASEIVLTLHRTIREFDRDLVIMSETTMSEHLGVMLFAPRMAAFILGIAGGLALLLAAVGLYGVVNYSVSRRTREVGIRMSLGADVASVRRLVMVGGLRLVAVGSAIGLVFAYAGARFVGSFLYGVGGTDPLTFLGVPILLASVALAAGYFPAYRASRVDPVQALRSD
jgi:predicted permease